MTDASFQQIQKLIAFVGAVVLTVLAFTITDNTTAQTTMVSAAWAIFGWLGLRRPGDVAPPQLPTPPADVRTPGSGSL